MTRRTSLLFLTILIPTVQAAGVPEITVHLFDQAGVAEKTLTQAVAVTTKIYAQGGVKLSWVSQPGPVPKPGKGFSFRQNSSPVEVSLRLLPKHLSGLIMGRRSVLGMAYDAKSHAYRSLANVFYDRVEDTAPAIYSVSVSELLGHVIAHELGHLLLGPNAHERGTLMACPWENGDFRLLRRGQLRFTPRQSESLRRQVAGRMAATKQRDKPMQATAAAANSGGEPAGR